MPCARGAECAGHEIDRGRARRSIRGDARRDISDRAHEALWDAIADPAQRDVRMKWPIETREPESMARGDDLCRERRELGRRRQAKPDHTGLSPGREGAHTVNGEVQRWLRSRNDAHGSRERLDDRFRLVAEKSERQVQLSGGRPANAFGCQRSKRLSRRVPSRSGLGVEVESEKEAQRHVDRRRASAGHGGSPTPHVAGLARILLDAEHRHLRVE